jgi:hypothetical protein
MEISGSDEFHPEIAKMRKTPPRSFAHLGAFEAYTYLRHGGRRPRARRFGNV